MTHALAVPLGRPERLDRVFEQIARQIRPPDLVIVVESGRGTGAVSDGDCVVLRAPPAPGAARNEAIRFARQNGIDWLSFWDDDDYYGPGYLAEVRDQIDRDDVDVLNKAIGFVRLDGELHLFDNARPTACLLSNSLTVRTSVAPFFPGLGSGEDIVWTAHVRARGARERLLSPWHFVYERHPRAHAYSASAVQFLRTFGPARRVLGPADAVDRPGAELVAVDVPLPSDDEVFADLEAVSLPAVRVRCPTF